MTHTPAPWDVHIDRHGFVTLSAGPEYVRDITDGFNIAGRLSQADAHLMRASPDLLDALEDLAHVIEEIETYGYAPNSGVALNRAYAVIAKAKGE